jgi:hypothetical protein
MPRQITILMTADEIEEEILYTRAALQADPDAEAFLPRTDSWLPKLDALRAVMRKRREATCNSDAKRGVANARLDTANRTFGDQLLLAVDKIRTSGRWTQFFGTHTITSFTKQSLSTQVATVRAWAGITDSVWAPHQAETLKWAVAAETALAETNNTAIIRGQAAIAEEAFAADLTRERDGLCAELGERGRERKLNRDFPDAFFRVDRRPRAEIAPAPDASAVVTPA